jgi:integrase
MRIEVIAMWLAEQQTLMASGKWSGKATVQLVEFRTFALHHIEIQTSSRGKNLHGATQSLYRRLLDLHLREFHSKEISTISSQQIERWWQNLLASGKVTTASKAYKLLHAVMNRALVDGLVGTNPCRVRGAHTASTGKALYVPTMEEVGALIDAIQPEFKAAIVLASYGGLRFGEWSALTRDDLELVSDSQGRYFRVHVTKALSKIDNLVTLGTTKSEDGVRVIDLGTQLTPILSMHLLAHTSSSKNGLLFEKPNGGYIGHEFFINRFNKAVALAGFPNLTPHALRHFGATMKVRLGMNFADLRMWLGDSTNQAALGYVHAAQTQSSRFREMPVPEQVLRINQERITI